MADMTDAYKIIRNPELGRPGLDRRIILK